MYMYFLKKEFLSKEDSDRMTRELEEVDSVYRYSDKILANLDDEI